MNMTNAPRRGFELETDGSKTKYIVLGGVAALFAVGVYAAASGGKAQPSHQAPSVKISSAERKPAPAPSAVPHEDAVMAPVTSDRAVATESLSSVPPTDPVPASAGDAPAQAVAQEAHAASLPSDDRASTAVPDVAVMDDVAGTGEVKKSGPAKLLRDMPPPAAAALQPWWNSASNADFRVQYVGQAAGQSAIIVRFSRNLATPADVAHYIHLVSRDGTKISGGWQSGSNDFVFVRSGLEPGRYVVKIDPALASAAGQKLAVALSGPVYIQ